VAPSVVNGSLRVAGGPAHRGCPLRVVGDPCMSLVPPVRRWCPLRVAGARYVSLMRRLWHCHAVWGPVVALVPCPRCWCPMRAVGELFGASMPRPLLWCPEVRLVSLSWPWSVESNPEGSKRENGRWAPNGGGSHSKRTVAVLKGGRGVATGIGASKGVETGGRRSKWMVGGQHGRWRLEASGGRLE
jgi:hypothetical protein